MQNFQGFEVLSCSQGKIGTSDCFNTAAKPALANENNREATLRDPPYEGEKSSRERQDKERELSMRWRRRIGLVLVPRSPFRYCLIMKKNKTEKARAAILAKAITDICVRNGFLEDLHNGITPSSKAGDYSDVKVVTPYGEIPWEKVSRISDEEMKRLMKGIVNQIYTFLCREDNPEFLQSFITMGSRYSARWDEPEAIEPLVTPRSISSKAAGSRSKTKETGLVSRASKRRKLGN